MKQLISILFLFIFGLSYSQKLGNLVYYSGAASINLKTKKREKGYIHYLVNEKDKVVLKYVNNGISDTINVGVDVLITDENKYKEKRFQGSSLLDYSRLHKKMKQEKWQPYPSEENVTVSYLDETRKINGITCKKAVINPRNGESIEVWYSSDYKGYTWFFTNFFRKIKGLIVLAKNTKTGVTLLELKKGYFL
jgi:GLPGLI family protein